MKVGSGEHTYEWIEHWVRLPETESGNANGRTHGLAVAGNGDVIIFNQAQPGVLRFSPDSKLKNAWGDRFSGAHGLTLAIDGDKEVLWLTDRRGRDVGVPSAKLAYIEVGPVDGDRRIGFGG